MTDELKDKVFDTIEKIAGTDEFREDPDMDLFEEDVLHSMTAMMLVVELEKEFDISLPPSEMERSDWNTANKIAQRVAEKLA